MKGFPFDNFSCLEVFATFHMASSSLKIVTYNIRAVRSNRAALCVGWIRYLVHGRGGGKLEAVHKAGLLVQAAKVAGQIDDGVLFLESFIGESIIKIAEGLFDLTKPEFATILLPVSFQNFALEVQSILAGRFDWMQLSSLC